MKVGIKVYMCNEISTRNEVKNMELGIKMYMYWEISIRMKPWRI